MIPQHKIFHTALFIIVFLQFVVCPLANSMKHEHIEKSVNVNKTWGNPDKLSVNYSQGMLEAVFSDTLPKCSTSYELFNLSGFESLQILQDQLLTRLLL